ncbi:MAG: LPS export ABC transporter periplasmic protein LptC [Gammaproteobacteria bacterium]|nr:LPS export ABC transporter periplasmic protein LptC [Gammaproteobacteria bacterium]
MSRLHYFLILLVVVMLAAFGNWLLKSIEITTQQQEQALRHDPDYYLDQFTGKSFNTDGSLHYTLKAGHLKHYPDDNSVHVSMPVLHMFREPNPPWILTADEGLILNDGQLIHLNGTVDITQSGPAQTMMKLVTRDLRIYTDQDYAETSARVDISQGTSWTTAVGMHADLRLGRLELLSKTRGKYEVQHP